MKTFIVILVVLLMALTSLWGVYAPSFSEAYILPIQLTDSSGNQLVNFQCRPEPSSEGKTMLIFQNPDLLRQTTSGMVHEKIILTYKGEPFFEGVVPGPMHALEIPTDSLPAAYRRLLNQ